MRFLIFGAGAVGSVLGGLLSHGKHEVVLIGRKAIVDAVKTDGLRLKSSTAEYHERIEAATTLKPAHITPDTIIVLTVKSHDTQDAIKEISKVAAPSMTILTMQNGIENEALAAEYFEHVIGGVWRMTCSMIHAGHATFRTLGRVIIGQYTKGSTVEVREILSALSDAGLNAVSSKSIMKDKWLKLALNTQSAVNAIVDKRDHDAPEFFELKAMILEETRDALRAAGMKPRSCDGKDDSIDEMIQTLRRPHTRRTRSGVNIHNSTWQDLYLKRSRIESDAYHGTVIRLAAAHELRVPHNEAVLEMVHGCHKNGGAPQSVRLQDLLCKVEERKND